MLSTASNQILLVALALADLRPHLERVGPGAGRPRAVRSHVRCSRFPRGSSPIAPTGETDRLAATASAARGARALLAWGSASGWVGARHDPRRLAAPGHGARAPDAGAAGDRAHARARGHLPRAMALFLGGDEGRGDRGACAGRLRLRGGRRSGPTRSASSFVLVAAIVCAMRIEQGAAHPARRSRRRSPRCSPASASCSSQPVVLGAISLDLFAVVLGGATALLPIYARDILHSGPWGLGLLRAAPAVGALAHVGAWLARRPLERHVGIMPVRVGGDLRARDRGVRPFSH